jgi:hypothetical protein
MKWPFAFFGKPRPTLCQQRKAAWGGVPKGYKVTAPVETRKQWKRLQITRRKSA